MDEPCPCLCCRCAFMQACCVYIGGTLSELGSTLPLLLQTNLLYFHRDTFAMFNSLLYHCTITDSDRVFPECLRLWCAKQTQTQVLVSVIDHCCLTHTLCSIFPLNLWGSLCCFCLALVLQCVRVCVCWCHWLCMGCVWPCLFAYICFSMERYRKSSVDNSHQSPTQKEIERGIEDGRKMEVTTGSSIWRKGEGET